MTDILRDQIEAITARHSRIRNGEYHLCSCGWYSDTPADTLREHPGHLADVLMRELGMQVGVSALFLVDGKKVIHKRYVTEWITNDRHSA